MPKENPDYTKTAENLCNPPEVMDLLVQFHREKNALAQLEDKLKENNKELFDEISKVSETLTDLDKSLREAIDKFGSYQDIESGEYAVKYRRTHKEYNADIFAEKFPEYPSVIVKAVDTAKLKALLKGELFTEAELKEKGILTETPSYSFYIR